MSKRIESGEFLSMKTRIVYPQLWLDRNFKKCGLEAKVLFSFLINNPFLGLSRYSRIDDDQILFSTGLKPLQLEKAKQELQELKWCYFYNGEWIYHNHDCAYMEFTGNSKVEKAREKELIDVPSNVKEVINGLITGCKPNINHKSEIINQKPETKKEIKNKEKDPNAEQVLAWYNEIFGKNLKSTHGFEDNLTFWLESYSLEDIHTALGVAVMDSYWRDKIDLTIFFRMKDQQGRDVDRIGQFLAKASKTQIKPKSNILAILEGAQ